MCESFACVREATQGGISRQPHHAPTQNRSLTTFHTPPPLFTPSSSSTHPLRATVTHVHPYCTGARQSNPTRALFPQAPALDTPTQPSPAETPTSTSGRASRAAQTQGAHPPGSVRWNQWVQQLQLAGLTPGQAAAALSSTPTLLDRDAGNKAEGFKNLSAVLMSERLLTARQLQQLLAGRPEVLMVAAKQAVVENIRWCTEVLGVDTTAWVGMALACRVLVRLQRRELQERYDFMVGAGLEGAGVRALWLRQPELLRNNAQAMAEKLRILAALFGVSGLQVLAQAPGVLMHASRGLRERAHFLQRLGHTQLSLVHIRHASTDAEFALQAVGAHVRASGTPLAQLWRELQGVPGGGGVPGEAQLRARQPDGAPLLPRVCDVLRANQDA
ncbi:MAG: hypothetical protein WDW38_000162 [Sanguina aurantia]